ncbi:MAG: TetR family transcriptional regulator [Acidimicrobiales bacterium]
MAEADDADAGGLIEPRAGEHIDARPFGRDAVCDALIDATIAFIMEEGLDVSIRRIAARAGVNHGLVHAYFENKQGLLSAAVDAINQRASLEVDDDGFPPPDLASRRGGELARAVARIQLDQGKDLGSSNPISSAWRAALASSRPDLTSTEIDTMSRDRIGARPGSGRSSPITCRISWVSTPSSGSRSTHTCRRSSHSSAGCPGQAPRCADRRAARWFCRPDEATQLGIVAWGAEPELLRAPRAGDRERAGDHPEAEQAEAGQHLLGGRAVGVLLAEFVRRGGVAGSGTERGGGLRRPGHERSNEEQDRHDHDHRSHRQLVEGEHPLSVLADAVAALLGRRHHQISLAPTTVDRVAIARTRRRGANIAEQS